MSEQQLTVHGGQPAPPPATPAAGTGTGRPSWLGPALRALVAVAVLAAVGALAGVVWEWWWTPPTGVVVHHQWLQDEDALLSDFSGTGTYVVVAVLAGLVASVLVAALLRGSELVTLLAVLLGSFLAGWLMLKVGTALGPADPSTAAATARDGTHLPAPLTAGGDVARLVFPGGAMIGLVVGYLGLGTRTGR